MFEIAVAKVISTLRYLRPSADFRETFPYNKLMYETLSQLTLGFPLYMSKSSIQIKERLYEFISLTTGDY